MMMLIVFSCFFIPYQLAFRQDTALTGIQYIYLIDVLFLADIVLNCFTSFRQHGIEVLDQRACLKRYSRTMLPIDLLSSLPLDLLAWMLIGNGQLMGGSMVLTLRLLRLLRIVRLFVLFRRWEAFSWSNPAVLRGIKFLVSVFLLMHWLACAWFLTAFASDFPVDSWAVRADIVAAGPMDQYIRSLYWTITTMTTVGYGDITPARPVEYVFSALIMLTGASLFAFIVGSIASLLSSIHADRNSHQERIDHVTHFLRQRNIPAELNSQVRNYYDYVWERNQGLDNNGMLNDLPKPLRLEIMLHLASHIIETVPLFKYCPPALRNALLLCLESRTFTPDSYVAREGASGKAVYFIIEGSVEIISREQKKSWGTMGKGEYFGFMSLLLGERRTATMVARGFCDLLILRSDDFNRIKAEFPEFQEVLKQTAAERTEKLSELILEGVVL